MNWTYEQAMTLLRKYEQEDEPVRVLYGSPSDDIEVGLVGRVKIVEAENETWLYVYGDDAPHLVGSALSNPPCIGFRLNPLLEFHFTQGNYHAPQTTSSDCGEPTILEITNPNTDDCLALHDLPGEPTFIPAYGAMINSQRGAIRNSNSKGDSHE